MEHYTALVIIDEARRLLIFLNISPTICGDVWAVRGRVPLQHIYLATSRTPHKYSDTSSKIFYVNTRAECGDDSISGLFLLQRERKQGT